MINSNIAGLVTKGERASIRRRHNNDSLTHATAILTPNFRETSEGSFSDGRTELLIVFAVRLASSNNDRRDCTPRHRGVHIVFDFCICSFVENDRKGDIYRHHRVSFALSSRYISVALSKTTEKRHLTPHYLRCLYP